MNEETLRQEITGIFEDMTENELISYWNEYCYNNSYYEDVIHYQYEFDDLCSGMSPLEIAEMVNGADVNGNEYFYDSIYGLEVGDCLDDLPVDIDTLVDYCIDSYEGLGIPEIDELLDEFFNQEDEEEGDDDEE